MEVGFGADVVDQQAMRFTGRPGDERVDSIEGNLPGAGKHLFARFAGAGHQHQGVAGGVELVYLGMVEFKAGL